MAPDPAFEADAGALAAPFGSTGNGIRAKQSGHQTRMPQDRFIPAVELQTILLFTISVCIVLAADARHRKLAWAWALSNILTSLSLYSYPANQPDAPTFINAMNSALALLAAFIKFSCLSAATQRVIRQRPVTGALVGIVAMVAITYICATPYRLFLLCTVGMVLAASSAVAVWSNRAWRDLPARKMLVATFVISFVMLVWRVTSAYPFGTQSSFVGNETEQQAGLALLISVTVFMQIGFLGLITGRMERLRQRSERRNASVAARARVLRDFNRRLAQAGEERLILLQLLTHEVRQPLNNAQAAIQSVLGELQTGLHEIRNTKVHALVLRTQKIIDAITLALSNAIVGASLVHREDSNARHAIEVGELVQLAAQDSPAAMQHRLRITQLPEPVFATVDPGLMRLAMRNLMDNAIKYSPAESPVEVNLDICDARMGLVFSTTNRVAEPFVMEDAVFALKTRGKDQVIEGDGIGLYVVSQVARVHHGTVSFSQPERGLVRFELFIPF